jgi:hypothetical protein
VHCRTALDQMQVHVAERQPRAVSEAADIVHVYTV